MSKRQEAIGILKEFGFEHHRGFIRFVRGEYLSSFQFHLDEIREVTVAQGEGVNKADGSIVTVCRVNIDLIGGGVAHSVPMHPERDKRNYERLSAALLLLRDSACGLPYADYHVRLVDTKFYTNPPVVDWPVETPAK
ncbi:hypothetical protein MPK67_gp055 [Erwinia phage pEa_SNUABM_32]|uniref:Uncharacterized protein n=2 Tax=Alexandravirus TaxID=2733088 RepID=A0AAE7XIU4_9CAUD|nr:hypothetical protein MPK67_gp055 [Erwinia phage pEa_SNUABM_32]YP_010301168.1 hypothetical protein MPK68_gp055 [Erwinia phage pEa_SNUABM_3]QZE56591.1 hypothetical protein pEaSNUABM20_00055 [Erwinia phage pEa_SNUABM_20]UAW52836.1 hypothetical protein pEaSNUABM23_00054 [Erwinia phage pEa_SNUABM_23]UIW10732.1 hypothetical protein pEaSNUABM23_00054 [Erwinia phage pEa_SNUABM_31]QZE56252.1 hypothetical protein pEaSNUABM3_00055 [Erwinia phage pEa_SNUABM_3]QZE56928.1 hypothetical protein pEaSNUABM3